MKDFITFTGDNMIPDPIDAQTALNVLAEFFLGEGYYIAVSCNQGQANAIITDEILSKFPKEYKEFCIKNGWTYKENNSKGLFDSLVEEMQNKLSKNFLLKRKDWFING